MIAIPPSTLATLAAELGGVLRGDGEAPVSGVARNTDAGRYALTPLLHAKYVQDAHAAALRGAVVLVDAALAARLPSDANAWVHPRPVEALAAVLDRAQVDDTPPRIGERSVVHPTAIVGPRVVIGSGVVIGPGVVIGGPGFGWVVGPRGATRPMPQLGGVVIEDEVYVGPLTTIDAGTLSPTRIGRGTKLDAHVHVGHNVAIGPGCIVAAQAGFAGSVTLGRGVLVGGQAGFADHVVVGDGARIAAKSGVIGDVPAGAIVAGYPAIARTRWLRGLAEVFRRRERRTLP